MSSLTMYALTDPKLAALIKKRAKDQPIAEVIGNLESDLSDCFESHNAKVMESAKATYEAAKNIDFSETRRLLDETEKLNDTPPSKPFDCSDETWMALFADRPSLTPIRGKGISHGSKKTDVRGGSKREGKNGHVWDSVIIENVWDESPDKGQTTEVMRQTWQTENKSLTVKTMLRKIGLDYIANLKGEGRGGAGPRRNIEQKIRNLFGEMY